MGGRRLTDEEVEAIKQTDPRRYYKINYGRQYRIKYHDSIRKAENLLHAEHREYFRTYNRVKQREFRERKKARAATQADANGTNINIPHDSAKGKAEND